MTAKGLATHKPQRPTRRGSRTRAVFTSWHITRRQLLTGFAVRRETCPAARHENEAISMGPSCAGSTPAAKAGAERREPGWEPRPCEARIFLLGRRARAGRRLRRPSRTLASYVPWKAAFTLCADGRRNDRLPGTLGTKSGAEGARCRVTNGSGTCPGRAVLFMTFAPVRLRPQSPISSRGGQETRPRTTQPPG